MLSLNKLECDIFKYKDYLQRRENMGLVRKTRSLFASFLSFLIVFSSMIPPVSAIGNPNKTSNLAIATISKEVFEAFEKEEYVELLIEMEEQVDTSQVALQAKQQLSISSTPREEKLAIRSAVVRALQSTAERTQAPLLQQLNSMEEVKEIHSFFIMNIIYVKTTKNVLEKIKYFPEIKKITLDKKFEVTWPERVTENEDVFTETIKDFQSSLEVSNETSNLSYEEDSTIEWNIKQINAPRVWEEYGVTGSGVVVGMIDSGASWTHEALRDKWRGYNPANPSNPNPEGNWLDAVEGRSMPYDISIPHGTHVLGTILGQDPEGRNKIGVAPDAKWIAARAFTEEGGQRSWLLEAGQFMLAPNGDYSLAPDIINNSWGGGPGKDEWYRPMVQAWVDAQILPVFASGNEYSTVATPANYPESFAVGAVDRHNELADFSNVGPAPYPEQPTKPDVVAPGVSIRSSIPGGYQGGWNGTSMAAPHIAGVAALLRSIDPTISVIEMENILRETATPITDSKYTNVPNYGYGYGLVDAYEAVSVIAPSASVITGQVLKEGTDDEAPSINHDAVTFAYQNLDLTLQAQVKDNVSVVQVELLIKNADMTDWDVYQFERISGNYLNGYYEIQVPEQYVKLPGFEYKIKVQDFSGNITETELYEVEVSFGIDPREPFNYDFEENLTGMLLFGDWELGIPEVGPAPLTGERLAATNLTGNYSNVSNSFLQLPPLDLRNVTEASITLKHWFDIEYLYDSGKILITNNIASGEWDVVETFTGRERTWQETTIDLTPYTQGEEQVYVGLLLESDNQVNHLGWYVDSFSLTNVSETSNKSNLETIKLENQLFSKEEKNDRYEKNELQNGLPVEAYVAVVETGRRAKTSLEDGTYTILHGPTSEGETYTLRVESYGYYPQEVSIEFGEEKTVEQNFLLIEIPRGSLELFVLHPDGIPVEEAEVNIVEDQRIEPLQTDSQGKVMFTNVLEGTYTVQIQKDNYFTKTISVDIEGGEVTETVIEFDKFPGEVIRYDDGTVENARAFNVSGLGFVTRMTPPENEEVHVIGTSVYIWGEDWPYPGGNELAITIYESNDNGDPGKRVFEPKIVEAVRGEWNYFDLRELNFKTDKDYYVVIIQPNEFEASPGIGIDEDGDFANRSYIFDNGTFDQLSSYYGNFMIRSHISFEIVPEAPVLTVPMEDIYTNDESYEVTGTVQSDGIVTIYNNEIEVASISSEGNTFSVEVPLNEGENLITATLTIGDAESERSEQFVIIQDVTAPDITVDNVPSRTKEIEQIISGTVTDDHFDKLLLNGEEVLVSNNSFSHKVSLIEGSNSFTLAAYDLAGNVTEINVEIELDLSVPEIYSVTPEEDIYLPVGEQIELLLTSDQSGLLVTVTVKNETDEVLDILTLEEKETAIYSTHWTLPENVKEAKFYYEIVDDLLNEIQVEANGKVIASEKIDRIYGDTRYETAIEISKLGWDSADIVIIARGDEFADALAGVPLAHQLNAPILLTRSYELYGAVKEELERLNPSKVILLGGEGAIKAEVEQELKDAGFMTERIAGQTRSETATLIANKMNLTANKAIIVNGLDYPDALAVASFAATEGLPILLTLPNSLPEVTKEALNSLGITETIVVGGTGVVSEEVFNQLPNPTRVSGADRYLTTVELFKYFNPTSDLIYVATGRGFADALTGATLAAKHNTGILLIRDPIPLVIEQYINTSDIKRIRLFGGKTAISDDVYDALKILLE